MAAALPGPGVNRLTRCDTPTLLMQAQLSWTIPNFVFKCNKQDKSQKITSAAFHAEDDKGVKWFLSLNPNGKEEGNQMWMSLYLNLKHSSKTPKSHVDYWLSIGVKAHQATTGSSFKELAVKDRRFNPGCGYGYTRFVLRDYVLSGNYLVDGSLTLGCRLQYKKELKETITAGPSASISYRPAALEAALSQSTLSNEMKGLLTSARFNDICFVVDEKEFPAHKLILSLRSPVFAAMFQHVDMKENQLNRVDVKDIEPKVFQALLHFIYTDQVELKNVKRSKKLLAAADRYLLLLLKCRCEDFLGGYLTQETCTEYLMLADLHNAPYLKEMSSDFIRRNWSVVMTTDGWKALKGSNPKLCCEILEKVVELDKI